MSEAGQGRTDQVKRLLRGGDYAAALVILDEKIAEAPGQAPLHWHRANCLSELGRHEEALAAVLRVIELNSDFGKAWLRRAELTLALRGDYPEREGDLQLAVALDPNLAPAHRALALLRHQRGRTAEAEPALDRALQLDSSDGEGFAIRALWHSNASRIPQAGEETMQQPNGTPLSRRRLEGAVEDLRRAVQLLADSSRYRMQLARRLQELGRHGEAVAEYDLLLAGLPQGHVLSGVATEMRRNAQAQAQESGEPAWKLAQAQAQARQQAEVRAAAEARAKAEAQEQERVREQERQKQEAAAAARAMPPPPPPAAPPPLPPLPPALPPAPPPLPRASLTTPEEDRAAALLRGPPPLRRATELPAALLEPLADDHPDAVLAASVAEKLYQLGHMPDSDYQPAPVETFPPFMRRFAFDARLQMAALGLHYLGDYDARHLVNVLGDRPLLRCYRSGDGSTAAASFAVRPAWPGLGGWLRGRYRVAQVVGFATEFSDGGFLVTSNGAGGDAFIGGARVDALALPATTRIGAMFERHYRRRDDYLRQHPGATVPQVTGMPALSAMQDRLRRARNEYRQSIGYASDEELQRLLGPRADLADRVREQLARMAAG